MAVRSFLTYFLARSGRSFPCQTKAAVSAKGGNYFSVYKFCSPYRNSTQYLDYWPFLYFRQLYVSTHLNLRQLDIISSLGALHIYDISQNRGAADPHHFLISKSHKSAYQPTFFCQQKSDFLSRGDVRPLWTIHNLLL